MESAQHTRSLARAIDLFESMNWYRRTNDCRTKRNTDDGRVQDLEDLAGSLWRWTRSSLIWRDLIANGFDSIEPKEPAEIVATSYRLVRRKCRNLSLTSATYWVVDIAAIALELISGIGGYRLHLRETWLL